MDPTDRENSRMCQMALLMQAGTVVEDLHDSLAEVPKPGNVPDADWTDYAKSKAKLNGRFLPKKSNDFAPCELMTLKPKIGESMVDYAARLRKFVEECDFTDWSADKMIK